MCITPLSQKNVSKRKVGEESRKKLFRKVGSLGNFSALISFLLKKKSNNPFCEFYQYHKTDCFLLKLKMNFCLRIIFFF